MAVSGRALRMRSAGTGLQRSRRHRLLAGVCGGIATHLAWPPWAVRLAFVIGSVIPVLPGFLAYLVMWLVVPLEKKDRLVPRAETATGQGRPARGSRQSLKPLS
jgi:phage shock protein C